MTEDRESASSQVKQNVPISCVQRAEEIMSRLEIKERSEPSDMPSAEL